MDWNKLTHSSQLEEIKSLSFEKTVLIFKHSTRCSISGTSLNRLLRNWKVDDSERIIPYYLDLIHFRSVSDQVEEEFGIIHQSPQVILIRKGKAVYDTSHFGISYPEIMSKA
jgi:bacillithiol system protein YtxJ